ncbi:hypothetical protein BGW42_004462 [Actinomortierella wolfii]|nr:hypothetical protein BGW42_004462 [Actinomortierella wolfii]
MTLPSINTISTAAGKVLCIADLRGNISQLNDLVDQTGAKVVIHSGEFGFYGKSHVLCSSNGERESLDRISDRTLKHVVQYSTLIPPQLRTRLLQSTVTAESLRSQIRASSTPLLSEFPLFLSGAKTLKVPVYTVWGACEDVNVLDKFRSKEYSIPNLNIIDESNTVVIDIGGVKLRLFGLGGAIVQHKLFDIGEGATTIAGGSGTMWSTALQIGQLVDTAQRVFDATETRVLVTHASPGREAILAQLALVLKADFTISAGLHFRYGISYNEFGVQGEQELYRNKLANAQKNFMDMWDGIKGQIEGHLSEEQRVLLDNCLTVVNRLPATNTLPGDKDEAAFKNMWNFNLTDAANGYLILDINQGKIATESRSQAHQNNCPFIPIKVIDSNPQQQDAILEDISTSSSSSHTTSPCSSPSLSSSASPVSSPRISGNARLPFSYRIPGPGTKVICETVSRAPPHSSKDTSSTTSSTPSKPMQFIHNLAPEVVIPPPKNTVGVPYVQSAEARKQQLRRQIRDRFRVKRSPNCFIIYRNEIHPKLVAMYGNRNNKEISRMAGACWKAEPPEVKNQYKQQAKVERDHHALINPGYKYQPARKPRGAKAAAKKQVQGMSSSTPSSTSSIVPSTLSSPRLVPQKALPVDRVSSLSNTTNTITSSEADGSITPNKLSRSPKLCVSSSEPAVTSMMNNDESNDFSTQCLREANAAGQRSQSRFTKSKSKGSGKNKKQAFIVTEMPLHEFLTKPQPVAPSTTCEPSSSSKERSPSPKTVPLSSGVVSSELLPAPPPLLPTIDKDNPSSSPWMQILYSDFDSLLYTGTLESDLDSITAMNMPMNTPLDLSPLGSSGLMPLQSPWSDSGFSQEQTAVPTVDHNALASTLPDASTCHGLDGSYVACPHTAPNAENMSLFSGDGDASHHLDISPFMLPSQQQPPIMPHTLGSKHVQPLGQQLATATTFKGPDGTTFILTVIPQAAPQPSSVQHGVPLKNCSMMASPPFTPTVEVPSSTSYLAPLDDSITTRTSAVHWPSGLPTPIDIDILSTSDASQPYHGLGVDLFDQAFAGTCSSSNMPVQTLPLQGQELLHQLHKDVLGCHADQNMSDTTTIATTIPSMVPPASTSQAIVSPLRPSMLMTRTPCTLELGYDLGDFTVVKDEQAGATNLDSLAPSYI